MLLSSGPHLSWSSHESAMTTGARASRIHLCIRENFEISRLVTLLPNCGIQPFFRTVAVGRWIWPQARLSRLGFSLLNSSPGVFSSFPCSSSQILYFFIRIQSPSSMLGHHCEKCSLDTESADEDDELDGDKGSDPKVLTLCFPRFFVLLLDP